MVMNLRGEFYNHVSKARSSILCPHGQSRANCAVPAPVSATQPKTFEPGKRAEADPLPHSAVVGRAASFDP